MSEKTVLTKKDINQVLTRYVISRQTCFNYETMQSGPWVWSMHPAMKKIYQDDDVLAEMKIHEKTASLRRARQAPASFSIIALFAKFCTCFCKYFSVIRHFFLTFLHTMRRTRARGQEKAGKMTKQAATCRLSEDENAMRPVRKPRPAAPMTSEIIIHRQRKKSREFLLNTDKKGWNFGVLRG